MITGFADYVFSSVCAPFLFVSICSCGRFLLQCIDVFRFHFITGPQLPCFAAYLLCSCVLFLPRPDSSIPQFLHEFCVVLGCFFIPLPVLLALPCPWPKDRGEDVWALRELPCGSVGAASQHTSLTPIPGSAGCPVLASHVGNRPVRRRLVRHWLIGVKGAGRRVCGGLPPGAGVAWFSRVGLCAVLGPCLCEIRSGLARSAP